MPITFTALVQQFPGLGGWHFIQVPQKYYPQFKNSPKKGTYGFIPITATLGTTTWKTSLLPGKGMYFIALKAGVRKKEKVGHGDKVTISFILG
jgi:hypothetical protein